MSMCNGQLLNFFILICGHIKKISHHYCVNIWTHIEKKVLTLELSSESTLKNQRNISTGLNATERFFLFLVFFYIHFAFILLFKDSMDTGHYCLCQYTHTHTQRQTDRQTDRRSEESRVGTE